MAGYLFSLDSEESLISCLENGVYSTVINSAPTNETWRIPFEGTIADYFSMKEGDLVFFFIKRKIYGIGRLKNLSINNDLTDCKFLNYPNADFPSIQNVQNNLFLASEDIRQRMICIFESYPNFFSDGVDMDDVLSSNPECFKMLRAFWKLSFIKLDDNESDCLFNVILKKCFHENNTVQSNYPIVHQEISDKLNLNYKLNANNVLNCASNGDLIRHEMAIEAGLIFQLATNEVETINIFGIADYISHQVIASPFKPVDYMDKMDIFTYSYIPNYKTKDIFNVIELKKDTGSIEDVDQTLKYVDWIKEEYASQDYSSIKAYLVAYSFNEDVLNYVEEHAVRNYTLGRRPITNGVWNSLKLVEYRFNEGTQKLEFTLLN